MSNCRGGIGPSAVSQLSSSELLSITRDASAFFGHRSNPTRFKSASEAQAYRKMLTIGAGVNGPRPVAAAVIASVQAALPCRLGRSLMMHRRLPVPVQAHMQEDEEDIEEPEPFVEDVSIELTPVPAVPEEVAREARLDAAWELHTYAAPAPKATSAPSFGGSVGSGDIAVGLSGPTVARSFSQVNPMRASGPTA